MWFFMSLIKFENVLLAPISITSRQFARSYWMIGNEIDWGMRVCLLNTTMRLGSEF